MAFKARKTSMQHLGASSPIPYGYKYPSQSRKRWRRNCCACCLQPALLQQSISSPKPARGPCEVLLLTAFPPLQPVGRKRSHRRVSSQLQQRHKPTVPSSSSPGLVCGAQFLGGCGSAGCRQCPGTRWGRQQEMLAEAPTLHAHGKLWCTWPLQGPQPPALQTKRKIGNPCPWLSVF